MMLTETQSYSLFCDYLMPILVPEYEVYEYGYDHSGAYVTFPYFDVSFTDMDFSNPEATLASIRHKECLSFILFV